MGPVPYGQCVSFTRPRHVHLWRFFCASSFGRIGGFSFSVLNGCIPNSRFSASVCSFFHLRRRAGISRHLQFVVHISRPLAGKMPMRTNSLAE